MRVTVILLGSMLCLSALRLPAEETVDWLGDYQQALAEARRTNRPIFLEFRCEA